MKGILRVLLLCLCFPYVAVADGVPVVFSLASGQDANDVYVTFFNCQSGAGLISGTFNNASGAQALSTSQSYTMKSLTSVTSVANGVPAGVPSIQLDSFPSGRIYLSIGGSPTATPCSEPSTDPNSGDASLGVRYQPMELDVTNGVVNADLTYIDYAAIALSLIVQNSTTTVTNSPLLTSVSSEVLTDALGKSSSPNYQTVQPSPSDRLPSANFARVLSPTTAAEVPDFHDWTNYLKTTLYQITTVQNKPIKISGLFSGVGNSPTGNPKTQQQLYDYLVTVDINGDITFTAQGNSGNGQMAPIPNGLQGPGVGNNNITATFADMNAATGIYGNNPKYTPQGEAKTAGIVNDFYGWVVGDFVAALSWGFPGSIVDFNGTPLGDYASTYWWGGTAVDGAIVAAADSAVGKGVVFGTAQPTEPDNYHSYGAALKGLTAAYGFGFEDRAGSTLINFGRAAQPNAYLEIGIGNQAVPAVQASSFQDTGITVNVDGFVPKTKTGAQLRSSYNTDDFVPYASICSFNATINTNGGCATFMIDSKELPSGTVSDFKLLKLYDSNSSSSPYQNYSSNGAQFTDGYWWITDLAGNHLALTDTVTYGTHYYIHFVVKDNGDYDADPVLGQITDPFVIGGTSSSGCVMNPNAGVKFELMALLGAAILLLAVRRFRDRRS
ncbi:hypothetical protein D0S45_04365 [Marinifilum sp. JC120]|nr:hypothetical protein D0S45_04365 [Marinifilum sp. JC120]